MKATQQLEGAILWQFLVALLPEVYKARSRLAEAVETAGGYVCSYIPDHTYRIVLARSELSSLASLPGTKFN